jgi:hypothetical protein
MSRRIWMIVIGAGASLVALMPAVAESPLAEAPAPPAADQPAVRIEQTLVAAPIVEEAAPLRAAVQRARPPARRQTRPEGFVSRTRQLIVGDGRYRPEPFPRAGQ